MDKAIVAAASAAAHYSPTMEIIVVFCATALIWFLGAAVAYYCLSDRRLYLVIVAAVLSVAMGWGFNRLIGLVYYRPRPFASFSEINAVIGVSEFSKSFPSDHAVISFALAASIFLVNRRWGAVFLVMAGLIAFGRVFAGVHYPSDILFGALFGGMAAVGGHKLVHIFLGTKHLKERKI
jgi:undecaprenyl-diphosphatase